MTPKKKQMKSRVSKFCNMNERFNKYLVLSLLFVSTFVKCECDPRAPAQPRKGGALLLEDLSEGEKQSKELEKEVESACTRHEKNKKDPQAIAELQQYAQKILGPIVAKKDEIKGKIEEAKKDPQKAIEYFSVMTNDLKTIEKIPGDLEIDVPGVGKKTKEEFMKAHADSIAKVREMKERIEKNNLKDLALFL